MGLAPGLVPEDACVQLSRFWMVVLLSCVVLGRAPNCRSGVRSSRTARCSVISPVSLKVVRGRGA